MTGEDVMAGIAKNEDRLRAAMLAGDAAALDALLADDLVFTDQNGHRLTKAIDLDAHRSGRLKLHRLDAEARQILPIGPTAAIVTLVTDLAGSFDGAPFTGRFAYTRVWSRTGADWQVAGAHCSPCTG